MDGPLLNRTTDGVSITGQKYQNGAQSHGSIRPKDAAFIGPVSSKNNPIFQDFFNAIHSSNANDKKSKLAYAEALHSSGRSRRCLIASSNTVLCSCGSSRLNAGH